MNNLLNVSLSHIPRGEGKANLEWSAYSTQGTEQCLSGATCSEAAPLFVLERARHEAQRAGSSSFALLRCHFLTHEMIDFIMPRETVRFHFSAAATAEAPTRSAKVLPALSLVCRFSTIACA